MLFVHLKSADARSQVHIQQVGQKELKRASNLAARAGEIRKKEKVLLEKHGLKGRL
jgi:acyl-CoA dehydrogenase